MEIWRKDKKKTINKILSVLTKGTVSDNNYRSLEQYFCIKNINKDFELEFEQNEYIQKLPLGLNQNIILIYQIFGNPNKEIYLGKWVIYSLIEAIEHYEDYCTNNQTNIFNIGYKYEGMGHVTVISCDLKTHLLFYRNDGGSNGYDRLDNYNKVINNGSTGYKQFYFSDWFYNIDTNISFEN